MIVIPVYNKQLISEGNLYFQTDEFKNLGGRAVQGERAVILQSRTFQKRDEVTEDNFYPIGVSGVLTTISSDPLFLAEMLIQGSP